MIIAIDGPTASGKSTVARDLAQTLGIYYVATGMLYRALAYLLVNHCHYKPEQLAQPRIDDLRACLAPGVFTYDYQPDKGAIIMFQGKDITPALKTKQIDDYSSRVSANPDVRNALLQFQRDLAQRHDVVVEGRDIGSVIFPNADFKFYITASLDERARRWQQFHNNNGKEYLFEESRTTIFERDKRDQEREVSPLVIPTDALVIDNSNLSKEETLQRVLEVIHRRGPSLP